MKALPGLGADDHLAFTAGETLQLGRLSETDIAAARAFFDLRYWGAYMAAKYGSSGIRPGGSIVFTSGCWNASPRRLVARRQHLLDDGRADAAACGGTRADPRQHRFSRRGDSLLWANMTAADREALYRQTAEKLPVGHVGEVEEIAEAYLYLMRQTYGTAQVLRVDGGGALA